MKRALVCGAGGFIGSHMVKRLKKEGFWVRGVDLKLPEFAADMGGAGFIFTGQNDADIMHNSALINLNMLEAVHRRNVRRIFYSSSACIYPLYNQLDPDNPKCSEDSAYPAAPDSEYGWEKLFSERMYAAYARNYGIEARTARYHNIFGPEGSWNNGKEKAPAAICRKVSSTLRLMVAELCMTSASCSPVKI